MRSSLNQFQFYFCVELFYGNFKYKQQQKLLRKKKCVFDLATLYNKNLSLHSIHVPNASNNTKKVGIRDQMNVRIIIIAMKREVFENVNFALKEV